MATDITKKPGQKPKGLTLKRGTENGKASITASWGNPADELQESSHQWANLDEKWVFMAVNTKGQKRQDMSSKYTEQRGDSHVTADRIWVRDKGIHESDTVWYNRARYHPRTEGRYLSKVTAYVYAMNRKGSGKPADATLEFTKPNKPSIPVPTYDQETGKLRFTINAANGDGKAERYDTVYWVTRLDNFTSDFKKEAYPTESFKPRTSTADTINVTDVSVADHQSILFNQWIRITCKAYSRGLMGNSETVTRHFYFAHPAVASIRGIDYSARAGASSILTIRVKTNSSTYHPVDTVRLERLANTTIGTQAMADRSTEWEEVDNAVDDRNAKGFSDLVSNAKPEATRHTWYRLVTQHGPLTATSLPVEAKKLYSETLPGNNISFISVETVDEGTAVRLHMGWPTDNYNITQVSWSDRWDAWESTEQPEVFDVDWTENTPATGYAHSAWVTIRGLDPDTAYYIRARRFIDDDGVERRTWWRALPDAYYPIYPSRAPGAVALEGPASVVRGEPMRLTWAHEGKAQTAWRAYRKVQASEGGTIVTRNVSLAEGRGPAQECLVPAGKMGTLASLTAYVSVSTGGDWTESNPVTVPILDRPVVSVTAPATLTAQPLTLGLECSTSSAAAVVRVSAAQPVAASAPDGGEPLAVGDVVWSARIDEPGWDEPETAGDPYTATVELPPGVDFRDGASYEVSVTAIERSSGLESDVATAPVDVAWAHQAVCPDTESTAITVDAAGLSATIVPAAPTGVAQTDVCDVYRMSHGTAQLIAADVGFGDTVTDRFAPYSNMDDRELAYRLCTRTADGDQDWADYPYDLRHYALRIDFGGDSVELPYNIEQSDQWDKGFGLSERWNGARVGSWDGGTTHRASLSTDLVRMESWETSRLVRQLAEYAGPCFVRTPDGQAFAADVQVASYGQSHANAAAPVSISATEVRPLPDEYEIQMEDRDPEGGE